MTKAISILFLSAALFAATKPGPTQYKRNMGRAGTVIIYPPPNDAGGSVGTPVAPDGTVIPCVGSTSSCIQEGFNYALAHGYDFHIMGGDTLQPACGHSGPGPGPGCGAIVYNVTTGGGAPGIDFDPTQGMQITSGPITINCTAAVTGPCVNVDSQEMTVMSFPGTQIVQFGSGPGLEFHGSGATPLDNVAGIIPFRFFVTTVGAATGAGQPAVKFDVGAGMISTSIEIDEINGGDYGILIIPSTSGFRHNYIKANFIHGQTGTTNPVVSFGSAGSAAYNNNIEMNEWHLGVGSPIANKRIFDLFQSNDILFLNIDNQPSGAAGIFFEKTGSSVADFNQIFTQGWGQGPVCGTCASVAHNRIYKAHTTAASSVSVGDSPWTYQNQVWMPQKIILSGGTVTKIELSGDASAFTDTGLTAGVFTLEPGEELRITHTGAPTMTEIH